MMAEIIVPEKDRRKPLHDESTYVRYQDRERVFLSLFPAGLATFTDGTVVSYQCATRRMKHTGDLDVLIYTIVEDHPDAYIFLYDLGWSLACADTMIGVRYAAVEV